MQKKSGKAEYRHLLGVPQWRSNKFHSVSTENFSPPFAIFDSRLRKVRKKLLYLPSGVECDYHFRLYFAYATKRMRNSWWTKDTAPRLDPELSFSDLKEKVAVQHVPPFILAVMQVKDRASAR